MRVFIDEYSVIPEESDAYMVAQGVLWESLSRRENNYSHYWEMIPRAKTVP